MRKKSLEIKELDFAALNILLLLLLLLLLSSSSLSLFITSKQGTYNYILETNIVSWAHIVTAIQ